MKITKSLGFVCCLLIAATAFAQIDSGPDGIGVYFDEEATQVSAAVPLGETVSAYLILVNPTQDGTLALREAHVGLNGSEPYPGIVWGDPENGFNMTTNMPGSSGWHFRGRRGNIRLAVLSPQ